MAADVLLRRERGGSVVVRPLGVKGLVLVFLGVVGLGTGISGAFGPWASVGSSLLMIGPAITVRDRLHDLWGAERWRLMSYLICAGGLVSLACNLGQPRVAVASMAAFFATEGTDSMVYEWRRRIHKPWLRRVNFSNSFAAAVDSTIFPTLAFGSFIPLVILSQFAVKVLGGLAASLYIHRRHH